MVCHPSAFSYVIGNALFRKASGGVAYTEQLISTAASVAVVVLAAVAIAPKSLLFLNLPTLSSYLFFIILGPICILFEYVINAFYYYLRKGILPTHFIIHPFWDRDNERLHLFLILLITIGEELIFRQMMFYIFMNVFEFSFLPALIITSVFYATNHIFMGPRIVGTKFFTGIIYGTLYYISGMALLAPVIAHYSQNVILLKYPWIVQRYARKD